MYPQASAINSSPTIQLNSWATTKTNEASEAGGDVQSHDAREEHCGGPEGAEDVLLLLCLQKFS